MKNIKIMLGLFLALAATSTLFGAESKPLFEDKIIARGKGFEVRKSQLEEAFVAFKASAVASGRLISEVQRSSVESNLLDRLIVSQILLKRATDEDRTKGQKKK